MELIKADRNDLSAILQIIQQTINIVYSNFYPTEIVHFFLNHHSIDAISTDIDKGNIYLLQIDGKPVGTGTVKENNIERVFVLPDYQGKGNGTLIMNYLEELVDQKYDYIELHSSLPAFNMYLKRGYIPIEYNTTAVDNGKILCYQIMRKNIVKVKNKKMNLNNKVFISVSNTPNGEVSGNTLFRYYQDENIIWAEYAGGEIKKGYLIGKFISFDKIQFSYQHINITEDIRMGICESDIEILKDGRLRMKESWQWFDKDKSKGESIIEELKI